MDKRIFSKFQKRNIVKLIILYILSLGTFIPTLVYFADLYPDKSWWMTVLEFNRHTSLSAERILSLLSFCLIPVILAQAYFMLPDKYKIKDITGNLLQYRNVKFSLILLALFILHTILLFPDIFSNTYSDLQDILILNEGFFSPGKRLFNFIIVFTTYWIIFRLAIILYRNIFINFSRIKAIVTLLVIILFSFPFFYTQNLKEECFDNFLAGLRNYGFIEENIPYTIHTFSHNFIPAKRGDQVEVSVINCSPSPAGSITAEYSSSVPQFYCDIFQYGWYSEVNVIHSGWLLSRWYKEIYIWSGIKWIRVKTFEEFHIHGYGGL